MDERGNSNVASTLILKGTGCSNDDGNFLRSLFQGWGLLCQDPKIGLSFLQRSHILKLKSLCCSFPSCWLCCRKSWKEKKEETERQVSLTVHLVCGPRPLFPGSDLCGRHVTAALQPALQCLLPCWLYVVMMSVLNRPPFYQHLVAKGRVESVFPTTSHLVQWSSSVMLKVCWIRLLTPFPLQDRAQTKQDF